MTELRWELEKVKPALDVTEPGKTYEETIQNRSAKIIASINELALEIFKSEPFYPNIVKEKLMQFVSSAQQEVISAESTGPEYWLGKQVRAQLLISAISEACEAIRKRVGTDPI
jgi:hypothetical protein